MTFIKYVNVFQFHIDQKWLEMLSKSDQLDIRIINLQCQSAHSVKKILRRPINEQLELCIHHNTNTGYLPEMFTCNTFYFS